MTWIKVWNKDVKGILFKGKNVKEVYYRGKKIWSAEPKPVPPSPVHWDFYYSDESFAEYQRLVDEVWSVQFESTGRQAYFYNPVYIWNRTILDFNWSFLYKYNADTLEYEILNRNLPDKFYKFEHRVRYFWEDRILTRYWLYDFSWNKISAFQNFHSVTPWNWVVRANEDFDIYVWEVNWDDITFSKVGSSRSDQFSWQLSCWHLWAYLLNSNDISWGGWSALIKDGSLEEYQIEWWDSSRNIHWFAWPDWKMYRYALRNNGWWRLQKIWTESEWFVWDILSSFWLAYWERFGKFLWNIVSWGMDRSNWRWTWYGSNNYFIDTDWNITLVQSDALAYNPTVSTRYWCIDELWYIYTVWEEWWWPILKTDKSFTNLNRKNPYLYR